MKNSKYTLSEWLSFAATIIASIAVIISAWQGYMFRQHNRLSVQPIVEIDLQKETIKRSFKKIYQHKTSIPGLKSESVKEYKEEMVWVTITNGGLGPAIIESQIITDNSKILDRDSLLDFVFGLGHAIYYDYIPVKRNSPIKPGESIRFLRIHESLLNRSGKVRKDQYTKFLSLEIEIKFCDLYGTKKIRNYKIGDIFPKLAINYNWKPM